MSTLHWATVGPLSIGLRWVCFPLGYGGSAFHWATVGQLSIGLRWGGSAFHWATLGPLSIGLRWVRFPLGYVGSAFHWATVGLLSIGLRWVRFSLGYFYNRTQELPGCVCLSACTNLLTQGIWVDITQ